MIFHTGCMCNDISYCEGLMKFYTGRGDISYREG